MIQSEVMRQVRKDIFLKIHGEYVKRIKGNIRDEIIRINPSSYTLAGWSSSVANSIRTQLRRFYDNRE